MLSMAIAGCAAKHDQPEAREQADNEPTPAKVALADEPAQPEKPAEKPASKPATTKVVAKKPAPKPIDDDSPQKWNQMQYGSLLSATFDNRRESGDFTHKG